MDKNIQKIFPSFKTFLRGVVSFCQNPLNLHTEIKIVFKIWDAHFEYRKARKMKRWGAMAKTFTRIGKEIAICIKTGGPDQLPTPRLRVLMQNAKSCQHAKREC